MASNLYMTVATRQKLEKLAVIDNRKLIDELEYLLDRRIKELSAPSEKENSPSVNSNANNPCLECQGKKGEAVND